MEGCAEGELVVLDVPMLEGDWADRIRGWSSRGPLLALLPFATWGEASLARASGASACLDGPFDPGDLVSALDRLAWEVRRGDSV